MCRLQTKRSLDFHQKGLAVPGLEKVEKPICRQYISSRASMQRTVRRGHLINARDSLDPAHRVMFLLFPDCNSFLIICRHKDMFQGLLCPIHFSLYS